MSTSLALLASCGWFGEDEKRQARETLERLGEASNRRIEQASRKIDSMDLEAVKTRVAEAGRALGPEDGANGSRDGRAPAIDWLALPDDAISCDPSNACRVRADIATAARADPLAAVPGAKLQVVSARGRPSGVRIVTLPEGSIPHELGFRSGDVVRSVNGIQVALPQTQFQLMMQLRGARRFDVEYERDGQPQRRTIEIVQ